MSVFARLINRNLVQKCNAYVSATASVFFNVSREYIASNKVHCNFAQNRGLFSECDFLSNQPYCPLTIQKRFKKNKKRPLRVQREEESEEESDDEAFNDLDMGEVEGAKDVRDITFDSPNLRVDAVLKNALKYQRQRIEEAIYDSRLRINGDIVVKKAEEVSKGDEIDFIKGFNQDNLENLDVCRLIIKEVSEKAVKDRVKIKARKYLNLVIPNYAEGKYEGTTVSSAVSVREERDADA